MLSETDIHWVTGFLYLISQREDITVVLGEKVYDEASESNRDVDITITSAGTTGMIGVEVKDKGRPLDVGIVEGICLKFLDMPTITSRSIVSASGYTAPARRKAEKHGIDCLRIVRGSVPPFQTIDFSRVHEMTVFYTDWIEGPNVHLAPNMNLTESEKAQLQPDKRLIYSSESNIPRVKTLKALSDRIANQITSAWLGPENKGDIPVQLNVEIEDAPTIEVGNRVVDLSKARVSGIVRVTEEIIPFDQSCYLETSSGDAFAAVALVQIRSGLLGLTVSSEGQELKVFHIPELVRKVRPIRRTLKSSLE